MIQKTQDNALFINEEEAHSVTDSDIKNKSGFNSEKIKHFLIDDNFNTLRQFQNDIYERYEISPSIRKLVNLLINDENLNQLKEHLAKQFSM